MTIRKKQAAESLFEKMRLKIIAEQERKRYAKIKSEAIEQS